MKIKDSTELKIIAEQLCDVINVDKSKITLVWNTLMGVYLDGVIDGKEEQKELSK